MADDAFDIVDEAPEGEEFSMDEEMVIDLDPERIEYNDDDLNLVPAFSRSEMGIAALKKIADEVIKNFDYDYDSTEEYRRRASEDWAVFSGDLPEKTFPYEFSANANVPMMLENITRLSARLEGEIFGDWTNIAGYVATGPDDEEEAETISLHLNWQLREQIRDFSRQMQRSILALLVFGDVTAHSYFDHDTRTNRHEVLTVDQFVPAYTYVSVMPDWSDIPHHTKILYLTERDMETHEAEWSNIDAALEGDAPTWDDNPEAKFAETVNEGSGVSTPDSDGPHKVLEYEGWLRLPEQPRMRWCKVVVHYGSQTVLSLMIHEEADWRDQIRFEGQRLEADDYRRQMQAYGTNIQTRDLDQRMFEDMAGTDQIVGPEFREQAMMQANSIPYPDEPLRPEWMDDDDSEPPPARMVPVRMYSHGVGIENMAGGHGLPQGRIQADHNRAVNTMLNQFLDSATQNNSWSLMCHKEVQFDQPFTVQPGAVNYVKGVRPEEMASAIRELRPGPASSQLMDGIGLIMETAQSSIQSPDVLSGEPGKSGETFRGISSRIEQATKQLSVMGRKYANGFLRQVLINNAKLNSIYLDDREIISITDWKVMQQKPITVGRDMYRRNYGVELRSDLRFTGEAQKIQEQNEMLQMILAIPALAQNIPLLYQAIKNVFEARKSYDLIALLGPQPPKPETPLGIQMQPPPPPTQGPPQ